MQGSIAFRAAGAGLLFFAVALAPSFGAEPTPLSIEEAAAMALESDPGVESATWDWLAAGAKAEEAQWRMFPSLSVAAGYQKISELPPSSMTIGATTFSFPASLTNIYSFNANLQYPVFAGFRIREAAAIADLLADGKQLAGEAVKRALLFEVRRAYWEAVRATANVETLRKNLELAAVNRDLAAKQAAQGAATQIDQLTADLRYKQADLDLGDAVSLQRRMHLVLCALTGNGGADRNLADVSLDAPLPFTLTTGPDAAPAHDFPDSPDEQACIAEALSRRPESRLSALSLRLAERGQKLAEAALYPAVGLTGNFTLADPNPRVYFQTDPTIFAATWALGIQVSYDLGGLPVNLKEKKAQSCGVNKAAADKVKQQNTVLTDVRTCLLNLARARRDLSLTRGMVDQARENLRVVQQRFALGMAGDAEMLNAQLGLLRSNFAVANKQIDFQVAAADLARALALDEIR
jgi:outer membrane protein TolC